MCDIISLQQAKADLQKNPAIRLVDVRTAEEYRNGHIAGSISIPLDVLGSVAPALLGKNELIYVHCRSGSRSDQAQSTLEDMGYKEVVNIGGIRGWDLVKD